MRIFAKNKMAKHNELGKEGENAAAEYLMSKGYSIRHRNWHSGKRELDIVAQKDGELIVVEVKTRRNEEFGKPEEAITDRKIRNIIISTDTYIKRFEIDLPVRFDIITVTGTEPPFHIEHTPPVCFHQKLLLRQRSNQHICCRIFQICLLKQKSILTFVLIYKYLGILLLTNTFCNLHQLIQ